MTLVKLARTLSDIIAVIRESNKLGAMVTTLMPYLARSLVIGKVSDATAPLEALYATTKSHFSINNSRWDAEGNRPWPGCPSKAADEATMITIPRSPSSPTGVVLARWGRTCRIRSIVPRTLTFMTKSKSSRENGLRFLSRIWRGDQLVI